MMTKAIYCMCILLLAVFFSVFGQNNDLIVDRITTEDGLSNNMVRSVIQDNTGFLWIGTNDGLNRFDGYEPKIFTHNPNDTNTLSNNIIYDLYEDVEGYIWIGTHNGLNRFDPDKEQFVRFFHDEDNPFSISSNSIRDIFMDHRGYLWLGTRTGGLNRFNQKTGEFKHYVVSGNNVSCIFEDHEGVLWIGTAQGELYKLNLRTEEYVQYANNLAEKVAIKENDVWFIKEDRENTLIVGMSAGLYRFNKSAGTFTTFLPAFENLGSFRNNEFHCIHEDPAGYIWLGTYGKGIYKYDLRNNTYVNYQLEPDNSNSLSNNDINLIFHDRSGVKWIATQDGLDKVDPSRSLFDHYQNIPGDPNSLSLNFVTSFCEQSKDVLWIGTFGGGISRFDRNSMSFNHYSNNPDNPNSLIHDAVRALYMDENGYLWIGTMYGVNRFDPSRKKFRQYIHEPDNPYSLSGNDIMDIIEDQYGMIWIGTYGDGLNKLNPVTGKTTRYLAADSSDHGLKSDYIRTIMEDSDGFIWIGAVEGGGLYRFDPKMDFFYHYSSGINDTTCLADNNINSIYEDDLGRLWIGTWNGLNLFNRSNERFVKFAVDDGLSHNKVVEILSDQDNNLWISTHKGLSRLIFDSPDDFRFINYSLSNGIQGDEFNINASLKASDGELIFGGTNGFNSFYPEQIPINEFIPPVVITDFLIYNESVPVKQEFHGRTILTSHISTTDDLWLKYQDKVISFEFSALSYSNQNKNKYAYMMEGIDPGWVETTAQRRYATYTNLEPGEYIFRVKGSNYDGIWNNEGDMVKITVAPPYWRTWWAYLIYAAVILLTLFAIRRMIMIRMQWKNDLFVERIEREKGEEINQMKLRFFTNISHEFKTPLTLIMGPLDELISGKNAVSRKVKDQLTMMHRNANRLLRLINQLIDFRKVERGSLELNVQEGDLVDFMSEIKNAFNDFAQKHRMNYQFVSSHKSVNAWFDRDKLEKIFYNLLSNAFKFTPDGGEIKVALSFSINPGKGRAKRIRSKVAGRGLSIETGINDYVEIFIEDRGIGISPERLPKIFDRFYKIEKSDRLKKSIEQDGSGIGLTLTKSLVELHNGEIKVESEEGKGSIFIVKLPLGKGHYTEEQIGPYPDETTPKVSYELTRFLESELHHEIQPEPEPENLQELDDKTPLILLVEDNADLRNFMRYSFEPVYRIVEAGNGEEALEKAFEFVPDLVITDVMMPVMNGIELSEKLKEDEKTSHIPVIMLTARDTVEDKITGFKTGADEYIPKPFNIRFLSVRINNLIESRKKLRDDIRKQLLMEPSEKKVQSSDDRFIERVMQIIEENISDPELTVDKFGSLVNMSRMQLYRKLKALTNLSANEFIRTVRLKRAAQLLAQNSMTISEITYEVGFSDPKYFSKCFHKQYGMTPSSYASENSPSRSHA